MTAPKPVLRGAGSKWTIAPWIIGYMPQHDSYGEPFFRSGAVFFSKPCCKFEIINDLDSNVTNFFTVLRDDDMREELAALIALTPWSREEHANCKDYDSVDDPVERARQFMVCSHQGYGSGDARGPSWRNSGKQHTGQALPRFWRGIPGRILAVADRLLDVEIENRPAVDVIQRYASPGMCWYLDPPYPKSTRNGRLYIHDDMSDNDHLDLLNLIDTLPGTFLISSSDNELYNERLSHWRKVAIEDTVEKGQKRIECLWLNPMCVERLGYGPLFDLCGKEPAL